MEKVVIIGAGAGGLSAGYLLNKHGVDFEILEASSLIAGRMKTNKDFADFPIPLGAEWIHTHAGIFQDMVDDDTVPVHVQTTGYAPNTLELVLNDGQSFVNEAYEPDLKFVNATWLTFYEDYIVPSIIDRIKTDCVVESIDYSGDEIIVQTNRGSVTAEKVIVSVPLKILQRRDIAFNPTLPCEKLEAIASIGIWDGFKAFIEFSEAFYYPFTTFEITPEADGQKLYYDASFGQSTRQYILGLFAMGAPALEYGSMNDAAFISFVLNELDEIYDGQATPNYVKHITQFWNDEPYILGGYITEYADRKTVRELRTPVDDKIYFAGGAYTDGNDWVNVHAAAQSAKDAVNEVLR